MKRIIFLLVLAVTHASAWAAEVSGVRLWTAPDHTRVVFDTTAPVEHKVFTLDEPDRLVLDIASASVAGALDAGAGISDQLLTGMRYARKPDGTLRVVLDLSKPARPKTFLLKPNASYGHRLVVDLYPTGATREPRVAKSTADIERARDVVVAIDAGHGGDDPGAAGSVHGTEEKRITLEIARRVKRLVDAQPGMRGVLTRSSDYYVGLRKRMDIARDNRADLFVSIHADAFRDKRVRGSSVYVLSARGASSEAARWLADKENAADLVGGVSLEDKDPALAELLMSLSQSATQHASFSAAGRVYQELGRVGKVLVGLAPEGDTLPPAGSEVLADGEVVGLAAED